MPDLMTIEKGAANDVREAILALHEKYKIPIKKYSESLRKNVSPFTGLIVTKNDAIVGMFTADGYEPNEGADQSVKDGDLIGFVSPAVGG